MSSDPKRLQSLKGQGDNPDREDEIFQEDAPKTFLSSNGQGQGDSA